jgi:CheY-like chemotaxis protein
MPHEPLMKTPGAIPQRVLLVEDNEAAGRGLARLLQAHGFEVTTVYDGTAALESLTSNPPPDFLLTDLQLPDIDGRDLARHARQLVPAPRVALLTGWDVESGLENSHESGIDWVLIKPIDIRDLMDKLTQSVGATDPPAPVVGEAPPWREGADRP